MTTAAQSLDFTNASAAQFRAWGSWISSSLTTFGFPKTSDTGQIDLTTVAAPSVANTASGYEIRTFNDAAQATTPIYFKIEYGSGTGATTPQVWITVATGSNGSGTLTGTITSGRGTVGSTSAAASGTTGYCYGWSDGSAFGFLMWPSQESTNAGFFFGLDRFRDQTGAATTHGASLFWTYSNSSSGLAQQRILPMVSGFANSSAAGNWMVLAPPNNALTAASNTTATQGLNFYPAPVFSGWVNRLYGPSQMLLACGSNDLAAGTTLSVSHYGTSRTFIGAGPGNATNFWGTTINSVSTSNYRSFMLRFD